MESIYVHGKGYKGYSLGQIAIDSGFWAPIDHSKNMYFQPTSAEIIEVEKIIKSFFRTWDRRKYVLSIDFPLQNYYRQYYGTFFNGKRTISVNFIHKHYFSSASDPKMEMKSNYITFSDGGSNRFNLEIDQFSKKIIFIGSNACGCTIYEDQ